MGSDTLDALKAGDREAASERLLDAVTSSEPHLKDKGAVQGLAERRFAELQIFGGGGYPLRGSEKTKSLGERFVADYNRVVGKEKDPIVRKARLRPLQRKYVKAARSEGLIR